MENKSHAIIAVSFLIFFLFATIAVFYWLSYREPEPRLYKIVTGQSVGVRPKSAVTFKGLQVGHVKSVTFDKQDPSKVDILLTVKKNALITQATYAVSELQGITGGHALVLKLGSGSRKPLTTSRDNPALIPLHKGLLSKIKSEAKRDMKKVSDIISNAQKLLDDKNTAHLSHTIKQIDAATRKIVQIENQLMPVAKQLPALAKSARKTLDQSHALLKQATQLAQMAKKPVKHLSKLTATGERIATTLERQTLPNIDQLSKSLLHTSQSIGELSDQLKANPQSLIFGGSKPKPGPGEPGFGPRASGD